MRQSETRRPREGAPQAKAPRPWAPFAKMVACYFTLEFEHGEQFVDISPVLRYNGGNINKFDNIDPDLMPQIESNTPTYDYKFKIDYGSTLYDGLPDTVVRYTTDPFDDLLDLDLLYVYNGILAEGTCDKRNRSRVDQIKSKLGDNCSGVRRESGLEEGKAKSNDYLSDEGNDHLYSPLNSDDDVINIRYQEFMEATNMCNPKLPLGMIFSSAIVFRMLIRQHAIMDGFDSRYLRNNGDRVTTVCS
ncbi:unnamed protein product [Ilex paraguariensis]|uniref:Uncharacterized protein n=1 Tax=Ilex paraguariensis TaxID=185542 RepID=A0ABC8R1X4_9AQUA